MYSENLTKIKHSSARGCTAANYGDMAQATSTDGDPSGAGGGALADNCMCCHNASPCSTQCPATNLLTDNHNPKCTALNQQP